MGLTSGLRVSRPVTASARCRRPPSASHARSAGPAREGEAGRLARGAEELSELLCSDAAKRPAGPGAVEHGDLQVLLAERLVLGHREGAHAELERVPDGQILAIVVAQKSADVL